MSATILACGPVFWAGGAQFRPDIGPRRIRSFSEGYFGGRRGME
jgi:hypothetical protein